MALATFFCIRVRKNERLGGLAVAIQLYCRGCKTYVPVTAKKCPKCNAVFTQDKKFRSSG